MIEDKNELILKYFDREISKEEFQILQDLMRSDPDMRALYYEHVLLEQSLDEMYGSSVLSTNSAKLRPASKSILRRDIKVTVLVAAACLVIGLMIAHFYQVQPQELTAKMRFSKNSKWSSSGDESVMANQLPIGCELIVESGAVELSLPRGVLAVIEAPAKLVMKNEAELYLSQGRGSFTVPEEGVGFTVTTARLRAVDLGTEFAVLSDWGEEDLVHVIKGGVSVSSVSQVTQELFAGSAVSVNSQGDMVSVDCRESLYQVQLPESVRILVEDDFELPSLRDGEKVLTIPSGWKRVGKLRGGYMGYLNPGNKGNYYKNDLSDGGEVMAGMSGKCVGYFYGIKNGGMERQIDRYSPDKFYTVSLSLGVRRLKSSHAGYSISLMSGDTVLKRISSAVAPCGANEFKSVILSWDSNNAPESLNSGDPLSVRISPYSHKLSKKSYLDFDDFKASVSRRGE